MITAKELAARLGYDIQLVAGDDELQMILQRAILRINAVDWERFRVRHEAAAKAKADARRRAAFAARHKR